MSEQSSNKDEFIDRASRKDELQFVLEEYKSIRAESQARMGHRITLLTSHMATVGILFGLALNALNSSSNSGYGDKILLLIPLISCLFGLLTAYHTALIYDMADYLRLIEIRINEVHSFVMGWHTSSNNSQFPKIFWMWHLPMMLITLAPSFVAVLLFLLAYPRMEPATIVLLFTDFILVIYFLIEYLSKIWRRRTYRHETTKAWAMQLKENGLIPYKYEFTQYGLPARTKRKIKRLIKLLIPCRFCKLTSACTRNGGIRY